MEENYLKQNTGTAGDYYNCSLITKLMNISPALHVIGVSEKDKVARPVRRAKKSCSSGFKALFAATVAVAVLLMYQVTKEAIGLHRALFNYQDKVEMISRVPVHFSHSMEQR